MSREAARSQFGPIDPVSAKVSRISECFKCSTPVRGAYKDHDLEDLSRVLFCELKPSDRDIDLYILEEKSQEPLVLAYFFIPCGHRFNQPKTECPSCKAKVHTSLPDHDFREIVRVLLPNSFERKNFLGSPELQEARKTFTFSFDYFSFKHKLLNASRFSLKKNTITIIHNFPINHFELNGKKAMVFFKQYFEDLLLSSGKKTTFHIDELQEVSFQNGKLFIVTNSLPMHLFMKPFREKKMHYLRLQSILSKEKMTLREGQSLCLSDCTGHALSIIYEGAYRLQKTSIERQFRITALDGGLTLLLPKPLPNH